MKEPTNFMEILDILGRWKVSKELDLGIGTVCAWGYRDSIPPDYWPALLEMARKNKERRITQEVLMRLYCRE